MSAKHTPGPLKVGVRGLSPAVRDGQGRLLAECPYHDRSATHFVLEQEAVANATLYAAAPLLLEALKEFVHNGYPATTDQQRADNARAAIATALGEQP